MAEDSAASRIVVGVDGSQSSIDALWWAARQAELTGAVLHLITAWSYPEEPTPFGIVPELPISADVMGEARRRLEDLQTVVRGRHRLKEVRADVVGGAPEAAVLNAAQGADLLVVGSRGRGALVGMLLGSVSEYCVRHAPCPVVVVRWADAAT